MNHRMNEIERPNKELIESALLIESAILKG